MKKWQKRMLKWGGIAAGSFFLLLVVAVILVNLFLPKDFIKQQVIQAIRDNLGREATVGDVSVRLSGKLAVSDLVIKERAGYGARPFVKLGAFAVGVRLLPLLKKQIILDEVALKGLEVSVVRDKGGFNYDDILAKFNPKIPAGTPAPAPAATPGKKPPFTVALRSFKFRGGAVHYDDRVMPFRQSVTDIDLDLAVTSFAAPIKVDLSFKLPAGDRAGKISIAGPVRLFKDESFSVDLKAVAATLDMTGKGIPLALAAPFLAGSVKDLGGEISLREKIEIKGADARLSGGAEVAGLRVGMSDFVQPVQLKSVRIENDVAANTETLKVGVTALKVIADGVSLSATGTMETLATPAIALRTDVRIESETLLPLIRAALGSAIPPDVAATGVVTLGADITAKGVVWGARGTLELGALGLDYGKMIAKPAGEPASVVFGASCDGRQITLSSVDVKLADGTLRASGAGAADFATFSLSAASEGIGMGIVRLSPFVRGQIQESKGAIALAGKADRTAAGLSFDAVATFLDVSVKPAALPGADVTLKGKIRVTPSEAVSEGLEAAVNGIAVKTAFRVKDYLAAPAIEATLDAPGLDLGPVLALVSPETAKALSGKLGALAVKAAARPGPDGRWLSEGTLALGSFDVALPVVAKSPFHDDHVSLAWKGGVDLAKKAIVFDDVKLATSAGIFNLAGSVSNYDKVLLFDVVLRAAVNADVALARYVTPVSPLPREITLAGTPAIEATAKGTMDNLAVTGRADFSAASVGYGEFFGKPAGVRLQSVFDVVSGQEIVVKSATVSMDALEAKTSGKLAGGAGEFTFEISRADAGLIALAPFLKGVVEGKGGSLQAKGVAVIGKEFDVKNGEVALNGFQVAYGQLVPAVTGVLVFPDLKRIELRNLQVAGVGGTVKFAGDVKEPRGAPVIAMEASSDAIDGDELMTKLAAAPAGTAPAPPPSTGGAPAGGTPAPAGGNPFIKTVTATAKIAVKSLKYKGLPVQDVGALVDLRGGVLTVRDIVGTFCGGKLSGLVTMDLAAAKPAWSVEKLQYGTGDVTPLVGALLVAGKLGAVGGLLDFNVSLKGSGTSTADILGSLAGSGGMKVRKGKISASPILGKVAGDLTGVLSVVAGALSLTPNSAQASTSVTNFAGALKEFNFQDMAADFTVGQGKAMAKSMLFKGDKFDLGVSGWLGLDGASQELRLNISNIKDGNPLLQDIAKVIGSVPITGSLSSPRADFLSGFKGVLGTGLIEKAKDKLEDTVKDIFKKKEEGGKTPEDPKKEEKKIEDEFKNLFKKKKK
ncbi:MAG: AsmA family protein [Planctomycetota bacterium]